MPKLKIAPSLLAADFSRLADEIRGVEAGGADLLHIDVMDGRFVPNISVGPVVIRAIRKTTQTELDVHLMIEEPWRHLEAFVKAGSNAITVHEEACKERLATCLNSIRASGCRVGVSIRPETPTDRIKDVLKICDSVLLMSVNPGFGGQSFMPEILPKIKALRKVFSGDIAVDGGINAKTAQDVVAAGANVLIAGTAIFSKADVKQAIQELRGAGKHDKD